MNDEPIINTQNCVFHKEDDYCSNPQVVQCSCAHVASCYFKEYERKMYECIELKKQLESTKGLITVGSKQYTQVMTAYDKIKSVLKTIKDIAYDGYNNGQTSYATFQCEKIIDIINEVEQ